MLVEREELMSLLGPKAAVPAGSTREFTLDETSRRARIEHDREGALYADVTEGLEGDATVVVFVRAVPDPDGGGLVTTGEDGSGEASDSHDPRSAAIAWRRMVNPMTASSL